jgi:hypothetical protein
VEEPLEDPGPTGGRDEAGRHLTSSPPRM